MTHNNDTRTRPGEAEAVDPAARAIVLYETDGLCDEWPRPCLDCDCFRDENREEFARRDRDRARAAVAAAYPLIAAAVREQVAQEIEAAELPGWWDYGSDHPCFGTGLELAAHIARGAR